MGKLEIKNEKFHSDGILENTTRFKNLVEVIEVDEEIIKRTTFDKKNNISTEVDKNSFQKEVEVNTNKEKEIKITDEDVLDLNKDKKLEVKINKVDLEKLGFRLGYKILSYGKNVVLFDKNRQEVLHSAREVKISEEEFTDIITKNSKAFKNFEKMPSQKVLLFFNDMLDN